MEFIEKYSCCIILLNTVFTMQLYKRPCINLICVITLLLVSYTPASLARSLPFLVAFMSPSEIRNLSKLSEVMIPPREYGYALEPLTWQELVGIISKEFNLAKLSRSVEQQRIYMVYRDELLKEWNSVYDHILFSKFDFEKRLIENTPQDGRNSTLWGAYPPLSEVKEIKIALRPNDFPYYFAEGIEHWCLWKLSDDVNGDEIEQAKRDLEDMHGDVIDFLSWRNPPHLKSLPDIDHIHILCLRQAKQK